MGTVPDELLVGNDCRLEICLFNFIGFIVTIKEIRASSAQSIVAYIAEGVQILCRAYPDICMSLRQAAVLTHFKTCEVHRAYHLGLRPKVYGQEGAYDS